MANGTQPLYVFLDESGNFDFSQKGSKYFVLTALTCKRPFDWENKLSDLRYELWEQNENVEFDYFHASHDRQHVRYQVFNIVKPHMPEFRVDAVIVEKNKTNPSLQHVERFYPKMMGYLLRYIFNGHDPKSYPEVKVITD